MPALFATLPSWSIFATFMLKITASTGTVGDSYDNALAENVNGSYKNELIHGRSWNDVVDVEIATFEWVNWCSQNSASTSAGVR